MPGLFMVVCLFLPAAAMARVVPPVPDSVGMDWSRAPEYRLVPGDKLTLNFGPSSDAPRGFLEREAIIRPDGRISVFPVGDVVAAGHTSRELEATLVNLLAESYKAPRIVVEVTGVAGNQVHVLGEVMKPGSYPAEAFLTVIQAITAAGGFKEGAAKNSVMVFHRDGSRDVYVARLAVDHRLKSGMAEGDVPLSRFDIVYVPRGAIGNMVAFTQSFFGSTSSILSSGLIGWELFNLDRVFRATR
jgi:protein involved in polysaccharide export with SLBB domain